MNPADQAIQERVDQLFDRFERMPDAELIMLRSVWETEDPTAREEAWTMVKAALRTNRRDKLLDDARNRIASWVNNYPPRGTFPDATGQMSLSGLDQASVRKAAIPPMLDAVAATIADDSLSQDERWVLLKPIEALAR
ncbi:MAG: hypothetical protein ABI725_02685 [Chloroflexota bacterium]